MLLNNRKIPLIPSSYCDNRFITDFKEKAELFTCFSLNNAPSFPIIVHFLTTLIILLKNAYLQSKAVAQTCCVKKLFLEILQNS